MRVFTKTVRKLQRSGPKILIFLKDGSRSRGFAVPALGITLYHIIRITIRTKRYISFCILLYCVIRARGLFSLGFVSRFCFRNEFTTRLITDHSRWHYKYLFILRNVFAVCRRPRTRPRDIIARVWCTRGIIYKFAAHNPLGRVARIPPGVGDEGMRN